MFMRTCGPCAAGSRAPPRAARAAAAGAARVAAAPRRARLVAAAGGNSADAGTAVEAGLKELSQEEFWPFLEGCADKLTVVDFFTDWCGPCKMIYPELVKFNAELAPRGGQVVKFNCNKTNKELGKELGIKVAPTFHLYRGREKLAEMTGAKVDKLREMVEANL
ncbi:MAG: thioredoxin F-type [Monoraphidium minutum]|nr:MAG: thioredoxin F-type [Monoraphidium minutum]